MKHSPPPVTDLTTYADQPLMVLFLALTLGLVSSFSHCILMCGTLSAYLGKVGGSLSSRQGLANMVVLHLFRVISYALMGALVAVLSFMSFAVLQSVPLREYTKPALAIFLITMALMQLFLPRLFRLNFLERWLAGIMGKLQGVHPRTIMITVGLLYGLIPCGMSYTAYLTAAAYAGLYATNIGSAYLMGAGFAGMFALGTTVTLVFAGSAGGLLRTPLFARLQFVAPLLLLATGIYFLRGVLF